MPDKPIRILQVVGGMNRGGVETWLMHVLRNIDREQYQMDFLVHTTEPCAYDEEIRALGSRIIACPYTKQPLRYARELRRILREEGPYDVVHSHVHHCSGWVLLIARLAGTQIRIVHSHSDNRRAQQQARLPRRLYLSFTHCLIWWTSTKGLAASREAALALFGPAWEQDARWQILYCAIDLAPFEAPPDPTLCEQFGIPANALVVGHVGRFHEAKNHTFMMDIAAEVIRKEPSVYFLLVGDGPLRPSIEAKASKLGILEHVIFAGLRSDVPQVMKSAMDIFLMPSLYEGLPLVGMEAQAAGLPCIYSDNVSTEADLIPELVTRLNLDTNTETWAEVVLDMLKSSPSVSKHEALVDIQHGPFNIAKSVIELQSLYNV